MGMREFITFLMRNAVVVMKAWCGGGAAGQRENSPASTLLLWRRGCWLDKLFSNSRRKCSGETVFHPDFINPSMT